MTETVKEVSEQDGILQQGSVPPINIDQILKELDIKNESRKKIGYNILKILVEKNIYRWEDLETTTGQKSTLLAHSIAVAKNMKVLLDGSNINNITKEKFILAALGHDICETCYGDVSVGVRKELDSSIIEILKKVLSLPKMSDDEFKKWLKDNQLEQIASDIKEVQDLLGLLQTWQTGFSRDPDALEILLIGSSHPLVGFVEKLETNFLYLRENLSNQIIERVFKEKDKPPFGYDAFQKKCWGVSSYFLKPLIEVLNNPDMPEELKQKCLGISYNYVKEILKNEKLQEAFNCKPSEIELYGVFGNAFLDFSPKDLTFEEFKSKIGEKGLIPAATAIYNDMQTNSDACYRGYNELRYKIAEKDDISEKETTPRDVKKEQTQGVFYELKDKLERSKKTPDIIELLSTHIKAINKELEAKKTLLEEVKTSRQMQKSTISASPVAITSRSDSMVFESSKKLAPISKEIPDKTGGLLATTGIIAQTITIINDTIRTFTTIITALNGLQPNREQISSGRTAA